MGSGDFEIELKIVLKRKQDDPYTAGMGRGIARLCKLVDETGSLNKAAKEMGMAYSKAWSIIKHTEEAFGFPLLDRKGNKGSTLTPEARKVIEAYDVIQRKLNGEAEELLKTLL